MGRGAWWAAVHGVVKSWIRLSDFTLTFHIYALEKEMAAHSSILARRIPGTAEPGGLPSKGSHRVRHDYSDLAAAAEKANNNSITMWALEAFVIKHIAREMYKLFILQLWVWVSMGFPGGSYGKEYVCNAGDLGSILELGRSSREGNVYPLQSSCLENLMDRRAWQATVHGVTNSQTRRVSMHAY